MFTHAERLLLNKDTMKTRDPEQAPLPIAEFKHPLINKDNSERNMDI